MRGTPASAPKDYVKSIVNPENPTPRGWGFQLPNPAASGALVFFDDCQHLTGTMVEAKGPGYANLLTFAQDSLSEDFLKQAKRQVEAAGDRPDNLAFRRAGGGRLRERTFQ